MSKFRFSASVIAAVVLSGLSASPSMCDDATSMPPFKAHVDMKTFMEHVLTPAATIIWSVNGSVIDAEGERDLSPKTDDDWERITSGAATLAEATNALMIPGRAQDAEWNRYVKKLADAADQAYQAAEAHDLKSVADVSNRLDGICASCHRHYGLE
jgi:hypothetical protein